MAHNGGLSPGRCVHSLVLTDIASGWTECVALVAREQSLVVEALKSRPEVYGFIAGLGGRDITPKVIREIADKTIDGTANERYINWIGVKI